jgi:hypothetical protein
MLLTKTVKTRWNTKTRKWYESKGYEFTKYNDEFEVKVEDLTDGSNALVDVICDCEDCKNPIIKSIAWVDYKRRVHNKDNKYYCQKCAVKLFGWKNTNKTKLLNSESFYDWCYRNLPKEQADEIMARWDYELNGCSPKDVGFTSRGINNKGYYFKCPRGIHKSELKRISNFVKSYKDFYSLNVLNCNDCDSIGQYLLDTYGQDALEKYWDYEKNNALGLAPFKIAKGSTQKVYMFCQKHKYHGSYFVACNSFTKENGSRCPYCVGKKIHPLDSLGQYIVNNYGKEFLDRVWSDKNKKSAFEYAPNGNQYAWWKCFDNKHDDYYRQINDSTRSEYRCPDCSNERTESFLQEKTRLYLESFEYGVFHEQFCTLKPKNIIEPPIGKNTKKRRKRSLRYDNEIIIENKHLFIEVMGQQHDSITTWTNKASNKYGTTPQEELKYQVAKDNYKEQYVYDQGKNYYYLAVWYYHFDKQDTYKKLIDDKINEILHKDTNAKVS